MTTPPTKEAAFKQRFISVMTDLQQDGIEDPEAMGLIGSLASDLADSLEQTSWSAAKRAMSPAAYDALLSSFMTRGNDYHRQGHKKHAYAIQVLGVSLVAATQRGDAQLAQGEKLLDEIIDRAVAIYRQGRPARN